MERKIIKTEQEYQFALQELDSMLNIDDNVRTQQQWDDLELLSVLIEKYENETSPVGLPDPIEAIKFRMEQEGLTRHDLQKYLGSASKVSEILNRKKPLSLSMIRALHDGLGIPAEVLLQKPEIEIPQKQYCVEQYSFSDMYKNGYFPWFSGTWTEAKEQSEELLEKFFSGFVIGKELCCKYSSQMVDSNTLKAWQCRICHKVKDISLPPYKKELLTKTFFQTIAKLSFYSNGPQMAIEHLNKFGIHVVFEPHLPKTYLDGAAFLLPDGHPVIGLTLRHNRLDNFWFTLLHELAHVKLHLNNNSVWFDDMDSVLDSENSKEQEANRWASNALIPSDVWEKEKDSLLSIRSSKKILEFAFQSQISPAVVAGRIRWEKKNYKIFSDLLGNVKPELIHET